MTYNLEKFRPDLHWLNQKIRGEREEVSEIDINRV